MGGGEAGAPPVSNPGKDLQKYITGLEGAMPQLLGIEGTSRPQFGQLNINDQQQYLDALLGMGGQANQASQSQLESARSSEIGNMRSNTGSVMDLLRGINPTGAQAVSNAGTMADQAFTRSQGPLSFQESRGADQMARESFGARGRVNDNVSVVGEAMNREGVMAAKRQEASQLGGQSLAMSQQYTDPAMGILSGSPASLLLGQDYLKSGQQAVGANTPQLIDTGAGISLGQQNASNLASWQQSNAAAKQAQNSQYTQIASALAMAAMSYSDKRLKTDINKVGKTDGGLDIFTYKFKGSPKTQMGVMAQDVEKKQPDAYGILSGGIKAVNYAKIK